MPAHALPGRLGEGPLNRTRVNVISKGDRLVLPETMLVLEANRVLLLLPWIHERLRVGGGGADF